MAEKVDLFSVVLLGASGQIGLFAVPRLVASGFEVTAVSRQGQPVDYPDFAGVRWRTPEEMTDNLTATLLLSAGPLNLVPGMLRKLPDITRVVAFSTSSVLTKADSRDARERAQIDDIVRAEEQVTEICRRRGIACCLLRPTLVYGCGVDRNVSVLARMIAKWPWLPVAGGAGGLRQPVHADDLAAAAVAALAVTERLPAELLLCGGSTLPYREMLHRIAAAQGRGLRLVSLPPGLLTVTLSLLGWLPGLRGIRPEMLRRQNHDLAFDDSAARELLGYRPRPFRPGAADFRRPESAVLQNLAQAAQ